MKAIASAAAKHGAVPRGSTLASSGRIHAIDFTKGTLVLLMVVYHVLNYQQFGTIPHDYIGFLPASFIMIAGFLAARVYLGTHQLPFPQLCQRLGVRALKLLLLFTVLNLAAQVVWSTNRYGTELSVHRFIEQWYRVYVTGDAQGVAFDVLVPISYTLLLAIPALSLQSLKPHFLAALAAAAFVLCATLASYERSFITLHLVSAGIIGMWLGTLDPRGVDRVTGPSPAVIVLLLAYVSIVAWMPDHYASQIAITCVALGAIYSVGRRVRPDGALERQVRLLGKYSLVSYVVQILYLQVARIVDPVPHLSRFGAAILVTLVIGLLTWMTALTLDRLRSRARAVDRLYLLVFG
jgi:hypothetical protein